MREKLKYIPNCITTLRIIGTVALLFTIPMSNLFFVIYCITGVTDVLDGFIARKFKFTSDFGAKLDSVADLLFYAVMLIMLLPILYEKLPISIWYGIAAVLIIRIASYITAAVKFHKFSSTHSYLNKITGACVFSVPFILLLPFAVPICWCICVVGALGSLHELILHLVSNTYTGNKAIQK